MRQRLLAYSRIDSNVWTDGTSAQEGTHKKDCIRDDIRSSSSERPHPRYPRREQLSRQNNISSIHQALWLAIGHHQPHPTGCVSPGTQHVIPWKPLWFLPNTWVWLDKKNLVSLVRSLPLFEFYSQSRMRSLLKGAVASPTLR